MSKRVNFSSIVEYKNYDGTEESGWMKIYDGMNPRSVIILRIVEYIQNSNFPEIHKILKFLAPFELKNLQDFIQDLMERIKSNNENKQPNTLVISNGPTYKISNMYYMSFYALLKHIEMLIGNNYQIKVY